MNFRFSWKSNLVGSRVGLLTVCKSLVGTTNGKGNFYVNLNKNVLPSTHYHLSMSLWECSRKKLVFANTRVTVYHSHVDSDLRTDAHHAMIRPRHRFESASAAISLYAVRSECGTGWNALVICTPLERITP